MTDELKAEREAFEKWVTEVWRPDDGRKLLEKEFPHFAFAAWQARAKLDRTHTTSLDVAWDTKSGLQPISTAPDKTLVVVAWVDEDQEDRYEFDYKEDGVWIYHNERYEHYSSCAPCDIPCTGPSEESPYTHWLELPIIDDVTAARKGGKA